VPAGMKNVSPRVHPCQLCRSPRKSLRHAHGNGCPAARCESWNLSAYDAGQLVARVNCRRRSRRHCIHGVFAHAARPRREQCREAQMRNVKSQKRFHQTGEASVRIRVTSHNLSVGSTLGLYKYIAILGHRWYGIMLKRRPAYLSHGITL
jgi:hypothetical protein